MIYIKAKSGLAKGARWPLEGRVVSIGRDSGCDIVIADPLVSRRHCEVSIEGGVPRLRDLGSSNATLVNGMPADDYDLSLGDEISVGQITFVLCDEEAAAPPQALRSAKTTLSLTEGEALYLSEGTESTQELGPDAAADMAQLFQFSRGFSRASSQEELIQFLDQALRQRFQPLHVWLGLPGSGDDLDFRLSPSSETARAWTPPERALKRALHELQGFLVPERVVESNTVHVRLMLVAPVYFGSQRIAAIAVETETPHRAYDETDLQFLVALSHTVAPFFGAIARREELQDEVERLRTSTARAPRLLGDSPAMGLLRERVRDVAESGQPALLVGETGTGKELVAHLIHQSTDRAAAPLVTVTCAAIPNDLFESELFGHERGAYTGAVRQRRGLLEQSDGGTLFLDEIGDLNLENQARILRAIETKRFRRVGGDQEIEVDFRLVSATNKNLSQEVDEGTFRRDLYHRIRGLELRLPPLRGRKSDIRDLATHFLEEARSTVKHPVRGFTPETPDFLCAQPWPGNVRELRHCVEAAAALCKDGVVTVEGIEAVLGTPKAEETPLPLAEVERRHILKAVQYCEGRTVDAAKLLGIGKTKLYERLNKYREMR